MTDPRPEIAAETTAVTVLSLLLQAHGAGLLSREEIVRELDDDVAAADALSGLKRAGLVHETDGFYFASKAAHEFERIAS